MSIRTLFSAALVGTALLIGSLPVLAAVITIDQPTPAPGPTSPLGAIDTRIGAGVPNTGGVTPDVPNAPGVGGPDAVVTNAQMAMNALGITNAELLAIANVGASSPVRVVMIGAADTAAAALAKALPESTSDIARLRGAIAANASFKTDLDAKNIDVAKIVAAEVARDGLLILYAMV
jgi:hypothetical protein